MNPALKPVTAPTEDPITVAEAKAHLRVDATLEDEEFADWITTAREWFEESTSSTLLLTTYDYALDEFPSGGDAIVLPRATPLVSVTSVTYTDSDGVATVWDSSKYILDTHSYLGSIRPAYNESYPTFTAYPVNPIIIRYVAGKAEASQIGKMAKAWLLLAVGALYENREMAAPASVKMQDVSAAFSTFLPAYQSEWVF